MRPSSSVRCSSSRSSFCSRIIARSAESRTTWSRPDLPGTYLQPSTNLTSFAMWYGSTNFASIRSASTCIQARRSQHDEGASRTWHSGVRAPHRRVGIVGEALGAATVKDDLFFRMKHTAESPMCGCQAQLVAWTREASSLDAV